MENPYEQWTIEDLKAALDKIENQLLLAGIKKTELQKKKFNYTVSKRDLIDRKKRRLGLLQDSINKEKNSARKASKRNSKNREAAMFDSQAKRITDDVVKIQNELNNLNTGVANLRMNKKMIQDVLKRRK